VTFGAVSFPQLGDASRAYRIMFHFKAKGQTGIGSEADAYDDIVYVVKGHAAFAIQSVDILAPFDTDLLQQFAKQALARVQQNPPAQ
jgi:hypothetical protein